MDCELIEIIELLISNITIHTISRIKECDSYIMGTNTKLNLNSLYILLSQNIDKLYFPVSNQSIYLNRLICIK